MADKFGLGSEIWDALRARTLNLPHDAGGNTIVDAENLGLGNKIILYDSGGLDLRLYPPTQAGLVEALGDATDGDTVWLPSIPITQTAGITLPAGVALRGIDHKAILNASGFTGTAIEMAIGALCSGFKLDFVSTLSTDKGIGAGYEDAIVHDVVVEVDEGIGIDLGGALLSEEAWFLTQYNNSVSNSGSIVYSTDAFVSDTNQPTWRICPRPAASDNIWDTGGSKTGAFVILEDGSSAFVTGRIAGSSPENWAIWRTDNPRAASPTWTEIIRGGADLDAYLEGVSLIVGNFVRNIERHGNKLYMSMRSTGGGGTERILAEFRTDTGGWTFFDDFNAIVNPNDARNERVAQYVITITKSSAAPNGMRLGGLVPGAVLDDSGFGAAIGSLPSNVWVNRLGTTILSNTPYLYIYRRGTGNINILRSGADHADRASGFVGEPYRMVVRGHLQGAGAAFVEYGGEGPTGSNVFVSEDGITFTEKTEWAGGTVEFVEQTTGATARACWIRRIVPTAEVDAQMFRKTANLFAATPTWNDAMGNFWGTQAQVDAGTAIMPIPRGAFVMESRDLFLAYR